jgi:excisionase family DNA binding protein
MTSRRWRDSLTPASRDLILGILGELVEDVVAERLAAESGRKLLTVCEAAERAGCADRTIRRWIKRGLPHFRHSGDRGDIRICPKELDAWIPDR